jgi:hypothetical protein
MMAIRANAGGCDERARGSKVICGRTAGTHSVTMRVAYADFERLTTPTVADIAMARSA